MLNTLVMGMALTIGQGSPTAPPPFPAMPLMQPGVAEVVPQRIPATLPAATTPSGRTSIPSRVMIVADQPMTPVEPKKADPEPKKDGNGNGEEKKEEDKAPEKGYFMRSIENTAFGAMLDSNGIKVDGWAAFSYNASTRNVTNLPYVWNDRADTALMQQLWLNIGKAPDWEIAEVQSGFMVAFLYGSDYRYTTIRGLFNNQLKNWREDPNELNGYEQNIYGGDIPLFYYSLFLPGIFEGTQVDIGRMFCQWGYESVMAPTTPLMSRSYAFNWAPPFFHVGAMATTKVDKNLTVKNMIINGNDVWFDGSQEWRYGGQILLTSDDEKQTLALSTSFGRGKFNPQRPNGPAQGITTIGLAYEPFGRNNFNTFDLVYVNKLSDEVIYALETIYGYQTNVPAEATGNAGNFNGGSGTATWYSIVNYLTLNLTEKVSTIARYELFYDAEGQRTGFEGWYHSATLGLQCRPCNDVIIRPEIRYDRNNYSRPFNGNHDIFVVGADVILKF